MLKQAKLEETTKAQHLKVILEIRGGWEHSQAEGQKLPSLRNSLSEHQKTGMIKMMDG
jgi:hypothetical protein